MVRKTYEKHNREGMPFRRPLHGFISVGVVCQRLVLVYFRS